jgi:hypothetical protein
VPEISRSRPARLAAYASASTRLALLSDRALSRMVDEAPPLGSGIGGTSVALEIDGVGVFAKMVPVTELELRPENSRSTANLFGLPGRYQYGVGSAGFGAWRELAAHVMTSNWVLGNEHPAFPLLYHWRVLPGSPAGAGVFAEFGDLDGAVAHWGGSSAIRARLEAISDSTTSLVLFLEYIPHSLGAWMSDQDLSVFDRVDRQLADTVAFMRGRGLVHFDAHFHNILTDGRRLYFSDFGLALSSRFELSADEAAFLSEHWDYDRNYTAAHLINHHVAERVRGDQDRRRFVRDWAEGKRPDGVPTAVAAILTAHAHTAVVMDDFHRRLLTESKQAPNPRAQLGD